MNDARENLRAELLNLEPLSPAYTQRLNQEIHAMFEHKLTHKMRLGWIAGLVAALFFACWGGVVVLWAPIDPFLRVIWVIYTCANLAFALYVLYILKIGTLNVRRLLAFWVISPVATLLCAIILFARAAAQPTMESLLWAGFGVMCLLLALAWTIHNRIARLELAHREQILRLEYRVVELVERLGPAQKQA